MIIDNLYTTASSISVGETTNQYRDEYTSTISQIYSSEGSVSQEAYWLGWISYDNLPIYCQHNSVTEDENSITFVNDTTVQNYPIGYVYNGGSETYNYVYMQNDEPFVTPANTCRFVNNLHPEYSAHMVSSNFGNIQVGCAITIGEIYRTLITVYCTDTGGLTGVISWLNGENTRTLTFSYSGNTYTIDVDLSQMTNTYFLEIPTNEDSEIIVTFSLIQILFSGNTRTKNGTSYGYTYMSPSTRILYDNGEETGNYNCFISSWGSTAMVGFAAYYDRIGYVRYRDAYTSPATYETRTGCTGTFLKADITALPDNGVLYNNNIMAYRRIVSGNNRTYFVALLSPKDIITAISLFYRVYYNAEDISANPTISSYVENLSWATDVNESNEFLGVLKTGNVTNSEFRNGLRTWQYTNIQYNDFTEDDIPEYEPEPGDDEPTTSGGDDHVPRRGFSIGGTGGFVTQYALSYSQLHEFANMLWAQFGDADFISNIGTTFLNDYSIKPSDILNYIVSMRVYPFNLADSVSYTDTQSNNIFIGRGVFPYILTTGSTHVIADTCETFDGGYCDVPHYYNDFRDYEPASSIEVYVPYCGSVSVAPSEVVGKRLRLTYGVDYSTGALSATLWVISDTNYTLAVLSGHVAASIQMSASNEMDGLLRLTSIATTIGKAMLSDDKIDASKIRDSAKNVAKATNALEMTSDLVNSVSSGLPVHSIGNTNGFSNFATPPRACITISYHKYKNPQNFAHVYGYKCNRRETLGDLDGYTKCKNVDVSGFTCHEDERNEIKALLESGVYL